MALYRLHQVDPEACANRICPREGTIVALVGGPPEIDLGYLVLQQAPEAPAVTGFLPAAVRADIVSLHGQADRGDETVAHIEAADRAIAKLYKPGPSPLGKLADNQGAYLAEVEDTARLFHAPFPWIESRTGRPCDRSALRLAVPGSEAKRLGELETATKAALVADAERNRRAIEYAERPYEGAIPDGEFWLGRELPPSGVRPDYTPHYVDPDDIAWVRCALPPGVSCALKNKPERRILRAGEKAPDGISNVVMKNAPAIEMLNDVWNENRRALRVSRKGYIPTARPESTLRYAALAEELVTQRSPRLNILISPWSFLRQQTAEDVVRGLRVPPGAATDIIDRIVGATRGYGNGWGRAEIETACVAAFESTDLAAVPWGVLIPPGWVDKIGERAAGILPALRRWLTGKDRATSGELVTALKEAGEDVDESNPNDHRAILKAMENVGFEKRRVRSATGERVPTFVREGTPKPQAPRWVKSVRDLYPED